MHYVCYVSKQFIFVNNLLKIRHCWNCSFAIVCAFPRVTAELQWCRWILLCPISVIQLHFIPQTMYLLLLSLHSKSIEISLTSFILFESRYPSAQWDFLYILYDSHCFKNWDCCYTFYWPINFVHKVCIWYFAPHIVILLQHF